MSKHHAIPQTQLVSMPGQPLGSFVEAAASAAANRLHTTSTALLTTTGALGVPVECSCMHSRGLCPSTNC